MSIKRDKAADKVGDKVEDKATCFGCLAGTAEPPSPGSAGVSPALDRATGTGVAVIGSAGGTPALPGWR